MIINVVFSQIQPDIGRSLFADDGALWKRGRIILHINGKMQEAIRKVEQWAYDWGFKFSVEKTKTVILRKKVLPDVSLQMYGGTLERVNVFRFLGVLLTQS